MNNVLIVAPHPDDETLGCGGTILKHNREGDKVYWLIASEITEEGGYSSEKIQARQQEIAEVAKLLNFEAYYQLGYPTTKLDRQPFGEIVGKISQLFQAVQPEIVYLPYPGDVHTDHKVVFDAVIACTKWFRYKSVRRVLVYETLSETDFGLNPDNNGFRPNVFVNISEFIDQKLQVMQVYEGESGTFPFPRSSQAIQGLASVRGASSGCMAAEAFMLLKEIID